MRSIKELAFPLVMPLLFCLVFPCAGQEPSQAAALSQLQILPVPPPQGTVGNPYRFLLEIDRRNVVVEWRLVKGSLPPGLTLRQRTGEIIGTPTVGGKYRVTVEARIPKTELSGQRELLLDVIAPLTLEWKEFPQIEGSTISGRLVVSNYSDDDFDLTLVVVAVNEIGRATALGYQHFELRNGTLQFEVPFHTSVAGGHYIVHADAVAEIPKRKAILRARLQTPSALEVVPAVIDMK